MTIRTIDRTKDASHLVVSLASWASNNRCTGNYPDGLSIGGALVFRGYESVSNPGL
jgi:hypothetical protein